MGSYLARRLALLLKELPPAEKAVAELILADVGKSVSLSISELARLARTSKTTVLRLCQRLGFSSFKDFRLALARESSYSLESLNLCITEEDDIPTLVAKVRQLHTEAINTALSSVDPKVLEQVAKLLLKARYIRLFASGGAAVTALDAHHKLIRMGLPSYLSLDQREQKMLAGLSEPNDVVWGFSFSGASISILEALKIARATGATIVSLTNNRNSPIARISHYSLFGVTNYLSHFTGTIEFRISQLSIVDSLFLTMIKIGLPEVYSPLQKTQEIIEADLYRRNKHNSNPEEGGDHG
ncbi:transcriptional regulator, RpiR family [Thermanaeromonas toyohensis ToBE]|uniref:Transcriptional regulator, RpiR family n=1 Tax=Thermanaeromonas toyohensis ToBE TaxID=698762 RepID=A0A1W1VFC2_9FIRM|nr:MurR/RpiR family transcriptional regulator [Thermanaeromonas toyohensis]SMB92068.1 transcriptional regulator, RpiR family [Thermanaeromonas toyohensis ToBE]